MPSYEDRKTIIQETLLKRLGRMFRVDERTPAVIEEACRAVVQRLPSDYDAAAVEAVCEEVGSRVASKHKYATWPSVAEIAEQCDAVMKERKAGEIGDGPKAAPPTPAKLARVWRDRADMLATYGARGLLEADGPAWVIDVTQDENGHETRRKRICRTRAAQQMASDLAGHYETLAYGDPRDVGELDWNAWPHETRVWRNGRKDDWTLEGARERIRRCDEMIAQDLGNPIWQSLRRIAVTAEARCAERDGTWSGRKEAGL